MSSSLSIDGLNKSTQYGLIPEKKENKFTNLATGVLKSSLELPNSNKNPSNEIKILKQTDKNGIFELRTGRSSSKPPLSKTSSSMTLSKDVETKITSRVSLLQNLRNNYYCLVNLKFSEKLKIFINQKGFLELTMDPLIDYNDAEKELIHRNISQNIIAALDLGISSFFDNQGHFIDLRMIVKLLQFNFNIINDLQCLLNSKFNKKNCDFSKYFIEESEVKKGLMKLSIPNNQYKLNVQEKFCLDCLLRLYPDTKDIEIPDSENLSKAPILPPTVFLEIFNEFIDLSQLLKLIFIVIKCDVVPLEQKIRVLNFLRILNESFTYRMEILNHKQQLTNILTIGKKLNLNALYICDEITNAIEKKPIKKGSGPNLLGDFFKNLLSGQPIDETHFNEVVNLIADDMRVVGSELIFSLSINKLHDDKHSNSITFFIKELLKPNSQNGTLNTEGIIRFCIMLANASLERNDYLTSLLIFVTLELENLFEQEHPKRKPLQNLLKKPKKIELDIKLWETYQDLKKVFASYSNYRTMIIEIFESNRKNIIVIPPITHIKRCISQHVETVHNYKKHLVTLEHRLNNLGYKYYLIDLNQKLKELGYNNEFATFEEKLMAFGNKKSFNSFEEMLMRLEEIHLELGVKEVRMHTLEEIKLKVKDSKDICLEEVKLKYIYDDSDFLIKFESILSNVLTFYRNSPDLKTDINMYMAEGFNHLKSEKSPSTISLE